MEYLWHNDKHQLGYGLAGNIPGSYNGEEEEEEVGGKLMFAEPVGLWNNLSK